MAKTFNITIEANDLGQLLDGLKVRAKSWENTASYLRAGEMPDEFFLAEECSDADEADNICQHYQRIIDSLRSQIDQQGGW